MKNLKLKEIDTEDIEDLLVKVEGSFDIKFSDCELAHVQTFGEMCDHIRDKIQLDQAEDCTTQQAFYKLRNAFMTTQQLEKGEILTDTLLKDLLPRKTRKLRTKKIEQDLGFELPILRPSHIVTWFFELLLLASFIGLFFSWLYGFAGVGLTISGHWIAGKIGNELNISTFGQLVEQITQENYLKSRRNPKTYNVNEIDKVLTDWFSNHFNLDESNLNRESRIS